MSVTVAGENLVASPSRSLFWPRESTLFVADLHLGKAASFRTLDLPIPGGTTFAALTRLSGALRTSGARRLVLLGDLWHDRHGRTTEVEGKLCQWREEWPDLEILLVTGNHDLKTGRRTEICGIIETDRVLLGPFVCRHHPEPSVDGYVLAGHLHPAVQLTGKANEAIKLPCFWFGPEVAVLPAFGEFTGTAAVVPSASDRVLVVADGLVIEVHAP
jgi:DNA ligase-associated metallophosphoesterase